MYEFALIAIRNNINHILIDPKIQKIEGIENIIVEITLHNKYKVTILGIYKHTFYDIDLFENYLTEIINKIPNSNNKILAGDFNIDLQKYETCNKTRNFFDNLLYKCICQYIHKPNRITPKSKTII